MSRNSPSLLKKKVPAKKQWKAVPSKLSATTPNKNLKSNELVLELIARLKSKYPDAHCALDHKNAFELLIATILSAQCTDERVNIVTKVLFARFPNAKALAQGPVSEIQDIIHSTGFYQNKSKNIQSCALQLVEKHKGQVPKNLEDLVLLAGVGRKTANVVLGNAFSIISGIVVDTHVTRLSQRWGWTKSDNAVVIERELQDLIPFDDWILISHLLIAHGRGLCKARNPDCENCFLFDLCPRRGVK